jgi:hypothetical protein
MNPEPGLPSSPAAAADAEPQGLLSRISGVYFSPGETFAAIGRAPKFILPMVILVLLAAGSNYLMTERIGYENLMRKQMQPMVERGFLTQEQADEQIRTRSTGTAAIIGKVQGPVTTGIGIALVLLAITGLFKLYSLIIGAENRFKPLLAVTTYTFLALSLIQTVLFVIVLYLKDPEEIDLINPVGSNLAAVLSLFSSPSKFVKALASWVDVFGIWRIALLSIGYAAVSHKMKVSTPATFLILLYVICAVLFSALASMFM